jgi:hypothetical protein
MAPLATVGILSIGDMGMGIAKLLIAKNYRVVTNLEGRRYGIWFIVASDCGHCSGLNLVLFSFERYAIAGSKLQVEDTLHQFIHCEIMIRSKIDRFTISTRC